MITKPISICGNKYTELTKIEESTSKFNVGLADDGKRYLSGVTNYT